MSHGSLLTTHLYDKVPLITHHILQQIAAFVVPLLVIIGWMCVASVTAVSLADAEAQSRAAALALFCRLRGQCRPVRQSGAGLTAAPDDHTLRVGPAR